MKNFSLFNGGKKDNSEDYSNSFMDGFYGDDSSVTETDTSDTGADLSAEDVTPAPAAKEGVSFGAGSAAVSLKVVKPKSYADAAVIADRLAAGSTVVLNIEDLDRELAIRMIDYLMGAVHVLGGDMMSVTRTTIVFAPKNVGLSDLDVAEDGDL